MPAHNPDADLLSLLERASNPLRSLGLKISLKGIFAPPQQWKNTDEANPNIFTYIIDCFDLHFVAGKIEPRKMTEKQLKDIEDLKTKKTGKKETKQEEKKAEEDPQAQKRRIEWQKLSEQERFYHSSEDPFKAFSLVFNDKFKEEKLTEGRLMKFLQAVSHNSLTITVTRRPQISEQDIGKLKKSKPKTLNLGELYAAQYKGSINLYTLKTPGQTFLSERVKVQFSGELPADCTKIDADKCYALIQIELSQPINPVIEIISPKTQQVLPSFAKSIGTKKKMVSKLKDDILKGIRAISQEYAALFMREKQHQEEKKNGGSVNANLHAVSTLRINEINKRKDVFLAEFIASGKFAMLKNRLTTSIQAIITDKFRKEKETGAISKEYMERTLAQMNIFFKEYLESTIDECMKNESSVVHEDLMFGHENNRSHRKQSIAPIINQSKKEREIRMATEYEIVGDYEKAQIKHINLICLGNFAVPSLESYARFCLRCHKQELAYVLYQRITRQSQELKYRLILAMFLIERKRKQALPLLGQLVAGQLPLAEKIVANQLLSLMHQLLGEEKKSEKYLALAERYFQIKMNPHIKADPPKNPYLEPTPRIPKHGKYVSPLSFTEVQQIRLNLVDMFAEYGFYNLVEKYLDKISESDRKNQLKVKILVQKGYFDEALKIVDEMLQKKHTSQLLLMKADICFRSEKLFESEEVYLQLLRAKPSLQQCYEFYLRLGLTYLNRKSWEDAKSTYMKACELKSNSSVGWYGLGVANFHVGLIKQSEEAFNLASIYNPISDDVKDNLSKIALLQREQNENSYKYLKPKE